MLRILKTARRGGGLASPWVLMVVLWVATGCAGNTSLSVQSPPGTTTTFILVRHAEKVGQSPDSPLSERGRRRSLVLADTLAPMGVTAIYCPALIRNKETVKPLADRLNLAIHTVPGWRLTHTRRFAAAFVRKTLADHAGGLIVWAGNSSAVGNLGSNLQELYRHLGGAGEGPRAYHDLYVMVVNDHGAVAIEKKQYGRVTP